MTIKKLKNYLWTHGYRKGYRDITRMEQIWRYGHRTRLTPIPLEKPMSTYLKSIFMWPSSDLGSEYWIDVHRRLIEEESKELT